MPKTYTLVLIADDDENSKVGEGRWAARVGIAKLTVGDDDSYSVKELSFIQDPSCFSFVGTENTGGRGLELSDLVSSNGVLYTGCDKTGFIYPLCAAPEEGGALVDIPEKVAALTYEDESKGGFKIEWFAEKDGEVYVGSHGRFDPKAQQGFKEVKVLDGSMQFVRSESWQEFYDGLNETLNLGPNGYVAMEAVDFNQQTQRWYFLPRKVCALQEGESFDFKQFQDATGSNIVISAAADLSDVQVMEIGEKDETKGFSSATFLPDSESVIVAIKTVESSSGDIASYLWVADVTTGEVKLNDHQLAGRSKYEGVFVSPAVSEEAEHGNFKTEFNAVLNAIASGGGAGGGGEGEGDGEGEKGEE